MAARARPCAARTRLLSSLPRKTGRCAPTPHPPIAASLLLSRPPKIYKIYRTSAAHRSYPDPSGNILWSKLCTVQPVFSFLYSSWIFSFCYSLLISSLLFISFLSIFSYPSLLISSYSSRRYYSSSSYSSLLIF